MGIYLVWKSRNKLVYLMLAAALGFLVFSFMPDTWHDRMETIEEYEADSSAMGRIKAWRMAFNLAMARPLGGGFETFKPDAYLMYLPEVGARRTDAHSIYFETMAEHGFIGLGLFLAIGLFSLMACGRLIRRTRGVESLLWMNQLARMIQVSLVGYAVSGLFLGLAYFDFYYALVAIIVGMKVVFEQESAALGLEHARAAPARAPVPAGRWQPAPPGPVMATRSKAVPGAPGGASETSSGATLKALPTPREAIELGKDWYRRL
jgi:probable O-glycosylation ligase (exosortase A-associated)